MSTPANGKFNKEKLESRSKFAVIWKMFQTPGLGKSPLSIVKPVDKTHHIFFILGTTFLVNKHSFHHQAIYLLQKDNIINSVTFIHKFRSIKAPPCTRPHK